MTKYLLAILFPILAILLAVALIKYLHIWIHSRNNQSELGPSVREFIKLMEEHSAEELEKPYLERNLYPQGTDAQLVVNCLCEVFLGKDWYVVDPICNSQVNTLILDEILYRYCKEYRKLVDKKRNSR